jgi:phospholipid/cholesterol/gamma-HCH transport system substrate-binding protein
MNQTRTLEITVGVFVALGMAALFMLTMKVSNITLSDDGAYEIVARFDNIGGLKARAHVSLGGVRVGRVSEISYDQARYQAVVKMHIQSQYARIPSDTSASVLTNGLLGDQYIGLEPGGLESYLKDKSEIKLTQPAMILEQIVGRFLFDKASGDSKK